MLTRFAPLSILVLALACAKPEEADKPLPTPPSVSTPEQGPAPMEFSTTKAEGPGAKTSVEVVVFKDPNCGCCKKWISYMESNGFKVSSQDRTDMSDIKREAGVPSQAQSCHTSKIGGYVIEGHVPVEDINRLLRERPDLRGLTVPGMIHGPPGMEGYPAQAYDVLALHKDGSTSVFAKH